jgi:hypothetical protein
MIRYLDGHKLVFLRFHNADHIVVSENGVERILAKSIWTSLPLWNEARAEDRRLRPVASAAIEVKGASAGYCHFPRP